MIFDERYALLLQGNLVSSESIRITNEIVALIEDHYQCRLDESNGAPIVTHLAVTIKKIMAREQLAEIPDVCRDEALTYKEEMDYARELVKFLKDAHQIDFNLSETAYLAVHLKNISQKAGREVEKKN